MKSLKYLFFFLIIVLSISACKQNSPKVNFTPKTKNVKMMIGEIQIDDFHIAPYNEWFDKEYEAYVVDTVSLINEAIDSNNIEIRVYFGSWCSDSRREVPRFVKILSELNFNYNKISFIGLDREKTAPNYKENIWDIQFVPTFIFLKNDKEIGRIIETPKETLEKDISKILNLV